MFMENLGLKGSANVRDLGGIACRDGMLRSKALLRGGSLHRLTPRDVALLRDDYHLKLVVDLRTDMEREEKPDVAIPGAANVSIPVFGESAIGITRERQSLKSLRSSGVASRLPNMEALYRTMMTGACIGSLAEVVRLVVERAGSDGAVLFHCTEGKDRTGVVSLVLLYLCGASYDDVMADYLYTNEIARRRARRIRLVAHLLTGDRAGTRKLENVFLADERYLDAALIAIGRKFGSFDAYVRHGLGIDDALRESFRNRMLV